MHWATWRARRRTTAAPRSYYRVASLLRQLSDYRNIAACPPQSRLYRPSPPRSKPSPAPFPRGVEILPTRANRGAAECLLGVAVALRGAGQLQDARLFGAVTGCWRQGGVPGPTNIPKSSQHTPPGASSAKTHSLGPGQRARNGPRQCCASPAVCSCGRCRGANAAGLWLPSLTRAARDRPRHWRAVRQSTDRRRTGHQSKPLRRM